MPYNIIFLLVLVCIGPATSVDPVKIKNILTDPQIDAVKKADNMDQAGYWKSNFEEIGKTIVKVTQLGSDAIAGAGVIGGFIALAAHNGPVLHNLTTEKQGRVKSLLVVFNPKDKIGHGDHKECINLLKELQGSGVMIYNFADEQNNKNDNTWLKNNGFEFKFDGCKKGEAAIKELESVKCLVTALCGVSVPNRVRDTANEAEDKKFKVKPILVEALDILPKIVEGKRVVPSLDAGNGQDDQGSWILGSKHDCTHIVTPFWVMGGLKLDKDNERIKYYIVDSPYLELLMKCADSTLPEGLKEDIIRLRADTFFKENHYAQVVYDGV